MVRIRHIFTLLVLSCGFLGCSGGWESRSVNIDHVKRNKTEFAHLDSMANYAVDSAGVECEGLSCREFSVYTSSYRADSLNKNDPLLIYVDQEIESIYLDEGSTTYRWNNSFYLEIFGCGSVDCLDAESIVFHNKDYSYSFLVKKGDFTITKIPYSAICPAKGDVYVFRLFNLKIDTEEIRIDWDIQMGRSDYEEWVDYHISPIWG